MSLGLGRPFGSASSIAASSSSSSAISSSSTLPPTATGPSPHSRDRLFDPNGSKKSGPAPAAATATPKKKLGSLGNLVSKREATVTGQLRARAPAYKEASEIFSVKFSLDDEYVAAGLGDASIAIHSTRTNELLHTLAPPTIDSHLPCTSIAFRPDSASYKNKNVMVAAYASGDIVHWHTTSAQPISHISESTPTSTSTSTSTSSSASLNQPYCITYNPSGSHFATAGSDCCVRVYDGSAVRLATTMSTGTGADTAGHSNRVFVVRFHPEDPHCLVSAGWDNTVQIWDTRKSRSIRSFYGPHICGEALSFHPTNPTQLITGSYRKDHALQLWSFLDGTLLETVPWTHPDNPDPHSTLLYSVTPSTSGRYVVAAGGSMHQVKLFGMGATTAKRPVGMVTNLPGTVYSAAMSHDEKMVAFGGSDQLLWSYDVDLIGLTDFLY
ncbi:hypothetical protein PhCBS80983_g05250 [Powellomyces hirtus]|uniref:Uncharacterized protein n=1 Tax=Powellomyces hirtus TaxID=109895 RepID=A0A507DWJ0_9FUNG|nr:hypothetical protein PhCBS80983_g05250 [Powellomyces hirtus]